MADKQRGQRLAQIRAAYSMTAKADPKLPLILAGCFLGTFVVLLVIGLVIGHAWYLGFLGVLLGILVATIVFGRRAERAAYSQVEGQPGAAAAVLDTLKRGWTVTPAVAVNRQQDIVHRAVGRAGIVLVGEGASHARVNQLMLAERKKMGRVAPDVPVHEVLAGNGEGEIPLRKLTRHVMRLPATMSKTDVDEVNKRLRAVGTMNLPVPKGPLPRGAKMPKMPKGGMR